MVSSIFNVLLIYLINHFYPKDSSAQTVQSHIWLSSLTYKLFHFSFLEFFTILFGATCWETYASFVDALNKVLQNMSQDQSKHLSFFVVIQLHSSDPELSSIQHKRNPWNFDEEWLLSKTSCFPHMAHCLHYEFIRLNLIRWIVLNHEWQEEYDIIRMVIIQANKSIFWSAKFDRTWIHTKSQVIV